VLVRHGHHVPAPGREKPLGAETGESLGAASVRSREPGAGRATAPRSSRRPRPRSPCRVAPRPHAPDFDRADRIGEFWSYPQSRAFAELLISCEEDRTLRAVLVGMLRETERSGY
jgi:hypothetical protein